MVDFHGNSFVQYIKVLLNMCICFPKSVFHSKVPEKNKIINTKRFFSLFKKTIESLSVFQSNNSNRKVNERIFCVKTKILDIDLLEKH